MHELIEKHIREKAFIWYSGRTSIGGWSCPAMITKVDRQKRTFQVMSLDDMHEQDQVYDFDVSKHSPESRRSMYPISEEDIQAYLAKREREVEDHVRHAQDALDKAKRDLERFRKQKEALPLSKT